MARWLQFRAVRIREIRERNSMNLNGTIKNKLFVLVLIASATGGACVSDEDDEELSPVGSWNLKITWSNGTCGEAGTDDTVLVVNKNGAAYAVTSTEQDVTTTGSVTCSSSQCTLTATQSGSDPDGSFSATFNLTLNASKAISGTGSLTWNLDGANCTQAFTVTGTKP
jgi:hypothetical protein